MFDVLTYTKGSAVLRMLEVYLGEDTFREGIRLYLSRHAYANTETSDLWAALEEASGQPVGEIMHGWIFQGGYPRLVVEPGEAGYQVTQEQFRFLGEGSQQWAVPALLAADGSDDRLLVGSDGSHVEAEKLRLNRGGHGFYRVQYSPELRHALAADVDSLTGAERYTLVSDTWANVLSGDVPASDFVELASRFQGETEPEVWGAVIGGLNELNRVISSDDRPDLQRFVRDLVGPASDRVGLAARR